jgi:hypothetical protein
MAVLAAMVMVACSGGGAGGGGLGFPVETPEDRGVNHLTEEEVAAIEAGTQSPPDYSSVPATSGTHAPNWAPCGIFRQQILEIYVVHTLEHGAVVAYYRPTDVTGDALAGLEELARDLSTHIIVMPYPEMTTPVALVAWGHLAARPALDLDEVRAFWAEYAQRGPESGIACPFEVDEAA